MMSLPAGVKVHLALGTTDMRSCVERMICARQRASFLQAGHQRTGLMAKLIGLGDRFGTGLHCRLGDDLVRTLHHADGRPWLLGAHRRRHFSRTMMGDSRSNGAHYFLKPDYAVNRARISFWCHRFIVILRLSIREFLILERRFVMDRWLRVR